MAIFRRAWIFGADDEAFQTKGLAQVGTAVPPTGRHSPKPAPSDIAKKYPIITSSERPGKPHGCPGDVHVAIAADKLQVDGVIVTLNSMIKRARRPARLCLHVFLLPDEVDFVTAALQCAFDKLQFEAAENSAYIVNGAWVTLRGEVDFAMAPKPPDLTSSGQNKTGAFAKDTGNLRVPHNFIRFYLYKLIHADKVIYLDVDIVVQGDITELWDDAELEESGATICAVVRQTSISIYVPGIVRPDSPVWMPLAAETFNAGVMVMDLKRWRERNIHERYEEWLRIRDVSREPLWVHGSQPLLLVMFYDEVCELDGMWNVVGLGHRLNYPDAILNAAKILHWTGPLKPWNSDGINRLIWEKSLLKYCPKLSYRRHTTTCRPDSWFC
eukprot:GEMP01042615.1.p1 GENE.GEMP01042615.1~~GEMP01042615.1.p1  ORF type:complete len:384 (+),score=84.11 GEMP01042615.1:311-1462(+)